MLHRHARPAVAGSFLFGAVLGGLTTSTAALLASGLLSPLPASARAVALLVGLALLGVHQAGAVRLPLPQRAYQIPQSVFHDRPTAAARRFAYELGTGVRTYVTTTAPYGLVAALLLVPPASLTGAVAASVLAGAGFGLGRSIIVLSHAWRPRVAVDHPAIWMQLAAWCSLAAVASLAIPALPTG